MAVYFDHRLDTERHGINTDVSWFSGDPMLAVTSDSDETGGSVNLFLEEVNKICSICLYSLSGRYQIHSCRV